MQQLTQRLEEETAAEYGMEISSEKNKLLVDSIKPRPATNIQMNGQTLEEVDQSISKISKDYTGAGTLPAMTRLAILWKTKPSVFPTKIILLSVLLYGCESWTLTFDLERRISLF